MTSLEPSQDISSPAHTEPPLEALYNQLSKYPFDADQEYQAGLAAILGHPETPVTQTELAEKSDLVLQAKCFYFSRRFSTPTIDPAAYTAWLRSEPAPSSTEQPPFPPSTTSPAQPPAPVAEPNTTGPEPPYPTSFAAIVDLITRNLPIPGIEEIPPTVLEPGSSKLDKTPRRKKPWEKDVEPDVARVSEIGQEVAPEGGKDAVHASGSAPTDSSPAETNTKAEERIDINGHKKTGQGVVKIIQPNAIPDSGLLGKD